MRRLRVTVEGRLWNTNGRRQRGFWDVGRLKDLSHAGFMRWVEGGCVVRTCWREEDRKLN